MKARNRGSSVTHLLERRLKRRQFLRGMLGTAGFAAAGSLLAACGGGSSGAAPTGAAKPTPAAAGGAAPAAATAAGKLEMFSWWTSGGEAAGLNAMYATFKKSHPNVDVVNQAVAGGAGSNAKAVLKSRMQGNDPPDSFQVHMGHELTDSYVAAGQTEPLDDLYKSEGFEQAFPKGVLELLSANGHYWSVPVNIHRANVLWYNKKLFADGQIQPPVSFDDFFAVAEKLKASNVTPLALGDSGPWASAHVFETVLLGVLGPDGYKGLWSGKTAWNDAKVTDALNTFKRMLGYVNTDHAALAWDQANDLLVQGKAAMYIMGDWANGEYTAKKFADYGWAPPPGTKGVFDVVSDTFALPKGAKNRQNALDWLKLAGSVEGQDAFNPLKGSIPANVNAGKAAGYNEYLQSAMKDFASQAIVPGLNAAVKDGWAEEFISAVNGFVTQQNVAATQKELASACENAGVCS
jgi:glucose/mannose transport system substrate-binding protein